MQAIEDNIGWLDSNADLKMTHISDLKYIKYYPF